MKETLKQQNAEKKLRDETMGGKEIYAVKNFLRERLFYTFHIYDMKVKLWGHQ